VTEPPVPSGPQRPTGADLSPEFLRLLSHRTVWIGATGGGTWAGLGVLVGRLAPGVPAIRVRLLALGVCWALTFCVGGPIYARYWLRRTGPTDDRREGDQKAAGDVTLGDG